MNEKAGIFPLIACGGLVVLSVLLVVLGHRQGDANAIKNATATAIASATAVAVKATAPPTAVPATPSAPKPTASS